MAGSRVPPLEDTKGSNCLSAVRVGLVARVLTQWRVVGDAVAVTVGRDGSCVGPPGAPPLGVCRRWVEVADPGLLLFDGGPERLVAMLFEEAVTLSQRTGGRVGYLGLGGADGLVFGSELGRGVPAGLFVGDGLVSGAGRAVVAEDPGEDGVARGGGGAYMGFSGWLVGRGVDVVGGAPAGEGDIELLAGHRRRGDGVGGVDR